LHVDDEASTTFIGIAPPALFGRLGWLFGGLVTESDDACLAVTQTQRAIDWAFTFEVHGLHAAFDLRRFAGAAKGLPAAHSFQSSGGRNIRKPPNIRSDSKQPSKIAYSKAVVKYSMRLGIAKGRFPSRIHPRSKPPGMDRPHTLSGGPKLSTYPTVAWGFRALKATSPITT
jgi:hypothetical protein